MSEPCMLSLSLSADQITSPDDSVVVTWAATGDFSSLWLSGDYDPDRGDYAYQQVTPSGTLSVRPGTSRSYFLIARDGQGDEITHITASVILKTQAPTQVWDGQTTLATRSGTIPDFGVNPTHATVKDGNWGDSTVWSTNTVPGLGHVVSVRHSIVYSGHSDVPLSCLGIANGGKLKFDPAVKTRLTTTNAIVYAGGTLEITDVSPAHTASLALLDAPYHAADTQKWGNIFLVLGTVKMAGPVRTPFVRLAAAPKAGDKSLVLAAPVSGWGPNDVLLLPDSRQGTFAQKFDHFEFCRLRGVSADGRTIFVHAPLQYDHPGDSTGQFTPHVVNLAHNIGVRSVNPLSPDRAHVLVTDFAQFDISGVAWHGLGRTTFDDTSTSNITKGLDGRHGLSLRYLVPPARVVGCSVFDPFPIIKQSKVKWGINLHDAHFSTIMDNVVFNWGGAGIALTASNETRNEVRRNFVCHITGTGNQNPVGREGDGIWARTCDNAITDNVVTNQYAGGNWIYAYALDLMYSGQAEYIYKPTKAGEDVRTIHTKTFNHSLPVWEFARNEAYGAQTGFGWWYVGYWGAAQTTAPQSVLADCVAWNLVMGVYLYPVYNVLVKGFKCRAVPGTDSTVGINMSDYAANTVVFDGADIYGPHQGLVPSSNCETPWVVKNSVIAADIGVNMTLLWTSAARSDKLPPREVRLENCKLLPLPSRTCKPVNIEKIVCGGNGVSTDVQVDALNFVDYQQVPGDSFGVYALDQEPDVIVCQTTYNADHTPRRLGCTEAGLTNTQALAKYGVCNRGSIVPDDAVVRADVSGYKCKPVTAPPPPPPPPPVITSFAPTSGRRWASVVITGLHLTGATSVTFNGSAATFTVDSDTQVTAIVPDDATSGPISLVTPNGTAASPGSFTVEIPPPPPSITAMNPTHGLVGSTIVLDGLHLAGATSITFNGTSADTWNVLSDTQVSVVVPAGATTGPVTLKTLDGIATSSDAFTVDAPPPPPALVIKMVPDAYARTVQVSYGRSVVLTLSFSGLKPDDDATIQTLFDAAKTLAEDLIASLGK